LSFLAVGLSVAGSGLSRKDRDQQSAGADLEKGISKRSYGVLENENRLDHLSGRRATPARSATDTSFAKDWARIFSITLHGKHNGRSLVGRR
jgi:hypothetical protein